MRNSFESAALNRLDLEKSFKKAEVSIEESRVHEEDLRDVYGQEVTRDLERVSKLEGQFAAQGSQESAEMKKVAEIFEALILECGELSEWFGENAFTIKTSRYDDYVNGVDMILEFRDEEGESASYLGLAADVTFASDTTKKFDRIKTHIEEGKLGRVKYFASEHMDMKGELPKLPEVVVGASKKTVMELSERWLEKDQEALAKHYAQVMILRQMREQLETFSLYARSIGQIEAAEIYASRIALVDDILRKKTAIENENGLEIMTDDVHSEIMMYLKNWKKQLSSSQTSHV